MHAIDLCVKRCVITHPTIFVLHLKSSSKKGVIIVIYGEAANYHTLRVLQFLFQLQQLQIAFALLFILLLQ